MELWAVRVLRTVIAVAVLGAAAVQVAMIAALLLGDDDTGPAWIPVALVVIGVLGVGCLQLVAFCIWRLLTRVRRGTVFAPDSFRYVDLVIGAVAGGAVLLLAVAVVGRFANHATPGDEVAPGMIALVCGLALVVGGVALVVYVLRLLLAQAVALDSRARHLQSELDEVI